MPSFKLVIVQTLESCGPGPVLCAIHGAEVETGLRVWCDPIWSQLAPPIIPGPFVPKSSTKGMVNKQGCAPWLEFLPWKKFAGLYMGKYILFACINIKFLL